VLIAEILLQQTNVHKALPAYLEIIKRWPTPRDLGQARETELESIIRPFGFGYRARTLRTLALELMGKHGGRVPASRGRLLKLPGVGPYIASAVVAFAGNKKQALIDAPISRVLARLFGLPPVPPDAHPSKELREIAELLIAPGYSRRLNLALLDFAATVCKLKKPRCDVCLLRERCDFYKSVVKPLPVTLKPR
jgi:A/G-specific adenine glycosylase